jgi:hypothetical protein
MIIFEDNDKNVTLIKVVEYSHHRHKYQLIPNNSENAIG